MSNDADAGQETGAFRQSQTPPAVYAERWARISLGKCAHRRRVGRATIVHSLKAFRSGIISGWSTIGLALLQIQKHQEKCFNSRWTESRRERMPVADR